MTEKPVSTVAIVVERVTHNGKVINSLPLVEVWFEGKQCSERREIGSVKR